MNKKGILYTICIVMLIIGGCAIYSGQYDIPNVGYSEVAFILADNFNFDAEFSFDQDYCTYEASHKNPEIINPSPHKYVLRITNVRTGQVSEIKNNGRLKGDQYDILVKTLEGKIISTHKLIIERSPNP